MSWGAQQIARKQISSWDTASKLSPRRRGRRTGPGGSKGAGRMLWTLLISSQTHLSEFLPLHLFVNKLSIHGKQH